MIRRVSLALAIAAAAATLPLAQLSAAPPDTARLDVAPPPAVKPAPATPAVDAQKVWKKTCAKCHGMDGKGQTPFADRLRSQGHKVPDLTTSDDPVEEFIDAITNGREGTKMKAFNKRLSAEEIKALADFAVSLRR